MSSQTPADASSEPSASDPSPTDLKPKRSREVIRKLGLDIIPVIVGILIALFINNIQQNAQDRKLLESTLLSLSEEFKENAVEIRQNLPRHQRLQDTLQKYREQPEYSIYDLLTNNTPLSTANIFTTHWQTTLNNNSLRFLNFKTIKLLSQIDAQHQEMRKQEDVLYPILFGPAMYKRGEEGKEYRQALEGWIISFKANEDKLLSLYKEFEQIFQTKQYRQELP